MKQRKRKKNNLDILKEKIPNFFPKSFDFSPIYLLKSKIKKKNKNHKKHLLFKHNQLKWSADALKSSLCYQ